MTERHARRIADDVDSSKTAITAMTADQLTILLAEDLPPIHAVAE
jgi:hypothetical protein